MIATPTIQAAKPGDVLTLAGEFGPETVMLYSSCGGLAPLLACVP
jgi:hypothetical protein